MCLASTSPSNKQNFIRLLLPLVECIQGTGSSTIKLILKVRRGTFKAQLANSNVSCEVNVCLGKMKLKRQGCSLGQLMEENVLGWILSVYLFVCMCVCLWGAYAVSKFQLKLSLYCQKIQKENLFFIKMVGILSLELEIFLSSICILALDSCCLNFDIKFDFFGSCARKKDSQTGQRCLDVADNCKLAVKGDNQNHFNMPDKKLVNI